MPMTLKFMNTPETTYQCPRCNDSKDIIEMADSIYCIYCKLSFKKKYLDSIEDKSTILAEEEKEDINKILHEDSDNLDM